jgi:UDP-N-acetylmuramoyl-L-alanyl-D-glutamate--2,6-diaminopimelate ligase
MTLADVFEQAKQPLPEDIDGSTGVAGLTLDSRRVGPGWIWFGSRDADADTTVYAGAAAAAGAALIVLPSEAETPSIATPVLRVESPRALLASLCDVFFGVSALSLRLIGVTGTNGKTTTASIARGLLQAMGTQTGFIGTTGCIVGGAAVQTGFTTPEAPLLYPLLRQARDGGDEAVAMEVSSHGLALHRVGTLKFALAIFTNLTQDHLDFHGSMEEYAAAKRRLFTDCVDAESAVVSWADDPLGRWMVEGTPARRVLLVGRNSEADIQIVDEEQELTHTSFTLFNTGDGSRWQVHSPLIGSFNTENLALCLCGLWMLRFPMERLIEAVARLAPPPGRLERVLLANGAVGVVDYAHTPDALRSVLKVARLLTHKSGGKVICVFGCGGNRDTAKRPLMGDIATSMADIAVVTSDNPRNENPQTIIRDILAGIAPEHREKVYVMIDRHEAIDLAVALSHTGDVVLVAGKGHEEYQIVGAETLPFSDREVLASL